MQDLLYRDSYNRMVMVISPVWSPGRYQVTYPYSVPDSPNGVPYLLNDPNGHQVVHQLEYHFLIKIHPNRHTGRIIINLFFNEERKN